MMLKYDRCSSLFLILASFLLVVTAGATTAFVIQIFLSQWSYDDFWSRGLLIIIASCVLLFLIGWCIFAGLAANFSGLSLRQALSRQSSVFLPLLLFIAYILMPKYAGQTLALCFCAVILGGILIIQIFLFFEYRKLRAGIRRNRLFDGKVVTFLACGVAALALSLRLHNAYILELATSGTTHASINRVLISVRHANPPGVFTWKTRVPPGGVLRVGAFANEKLHKGALSAPLHYDIYARSEDGKKHMISTGELESRDISWIKCDVSAFSGKTATFKFEIKEPFSVKGLPSRLHTLLRRSMWESAIQGKGLGNLIQAYWGNPFVYARLKPEEANILCIVVDTLRADHMGCYGYEFDTTPVIDRLAQSGVLFKQVISQSPWTIPSFASIYTGRLPSSHGAGELRNLAISKLSPQPGLLSALRENGYYVIGFVNNTFLSEKFGMHYYFDEYHEYTGDARNGSALVSQWLQSNTDVKFFCLLHYMDPHKPRKNRAGPCPPGKESAAALPDERIAPEESKYVRVACSKSPAYDSEIAFTDDHIGTVFEKMDELGLRDNTLIIFTADHGEMLRHPSGHGHGHTLSDQLLHVPLIFSFAGRFPQGKEVGAQVRLIDILPTVLDMFDIDFDENTISGKSFLPMMFGETSDDRTAISEYLLFKGELKSIRSGRYKLIYRPATGKVKLFDILADPGEKANLSDKKPEIRDSLLNELKAKLEKSSLQHPVGAEAAVIGEETRKSLKALGYLN